MIVVVFNDFGGFGTYSPVLIRCINDQHTRSASSIGVQPPLVVHSPDSTLPAWFLNLEQ